MAEAGTELRSFRCRVRVLSTTLSAVSTLHFPPPFKAHLFPSGLEAGLFKVSNSVSFTHFNSVSTGSLLWLALVDPHPPLDPHLNNWHLVSTGGSVFSLLALVTQSHV